MNKNCLSHVIDKIQVQRLVVDGQKTPVYEAYAFLKTSVRGFVSQNAIYGDCDGSGTAANEKQAIEIAVTEALERWAFYTVSRQNEKRQDLGLSENDSTTGFAADRRFNFLARRRALAEAAERWSVRNWWTGYGMAGRLEQKSENHFELWSLQSPHSKVTVVLAIKKTGSSLYPYAYGFAGAYGWNKKSRLIKACHRALVELNRNKRNLLLAESQNLTPVNLVERRLCFFAKEEGYRAVNERLNAAHDKPITQRGPNLIVDKAVCGDWSSWVKVWRCLYKGDFDVTVDETSEQIFDF